MEVILLEQVEKLGKVGDIVNVRSGFARNFLIPNKKALRATTENKAYYESEKENLIARNDKIREEAKKLYDLINNKVVFIIRHSSEEGKLYGSVMPKDIAEAVSSFFKNKVEKRYIVLENPIREIGLYPVKVRLHPEFLATVVINVARSVEEAKANAQRKKDEEQAKLEASQASVKKKVADKQEESAQESVES